MVFREAASTSVGRTRVGSHVPFNYYFPFRIKIFGSSLGRTGLLEFVFFVVNFLDVVAYGYVYTSVDVANLPPTGSRFWRARPIEDFHRGVFLAGNPPWDGEERVSPFIISNGCANAIEARDDYRWVAVFWSVINAGGVEGRLVFQATKACCLISSADSRVIVGGSIHRGVVISYVRSFVVRLFMEDSYRRVCFISFYGDFRVNYHDLGRMLIIVRAMCTNCSLRIMSVWDAFELVYFSALNDAICTYVCARYRSVREAYFSRSIARCAIHVTAIRIVRWEVEVQAYAGR